MRFLTQLIYSVTIFWFLVALVVLTAAGMLDDWANTPQNGKKESD